MSGHALHQVRVSQIPLRPSDKGIISYHQQPAIDEEGVVEKHSSLDHVRYNIVCEFSPQTFVNHLLIRFTKISQPRVSKIHNPTRIFLNGIWCSNAQD